MILFRHWKIIFCLLVVFMAGLTVGSLGTIGFIHKRFQERMNPDNWAPRTLVWLSKELDLTPEQKEQIKPAVEQMAGELKDLRDSADLDRRRIIARMIRDINEHLTPSQQEELRNTIEEFRKKTNKSDQDPTG